MLCSVRVTEKPLKNQWICDSERTVVQSPVMELIEKDCRSSEDDRRHRFYLLRSRDWCNIIPVTEDGKVVLVRQHRIGINEHTHEMPGGVADPDEQDPELTAIREMTEETGYVPLPDARVTRLGDSMANPAILNNRVHSFIIGPVRRERKQNLDPGEMIEVVEVPLEEIPDWIADGRIGHSLMLTAFLLLALQDSESPELIRRQLRAYSRCD